MSQIILKTIFYRILTIFFDTLVILALKVPIKQAIGAAFLIEVVLHSIVYFCFESAWSWHRKQIPK